MTERGSVASDARAVLFPVVDPLDSPHWVLEFLAAGGRGVVLGMTHDEYVARTMSIERRQAETSELVRRFTGGLRSAANAPLLIAADAEPGGIERLHDLVPALPSGKELLDRPRQAIAEAARSTAYAARMLGLSMFLGPICDEVTGDNPWLKGRFLDASANEIASIGSTLVEAIQSTGMIATPKHFPGYPHLDGDPATDVVTQRAMDGSLERSLVPFRSVAQAGARAIMVGPAPIDALDTERAPSESRAAIRLLRDELGFKGVIVSDDLDAASTLRGREVGSVAVSCLQSGSDLLLIGDGEAVKAVASEIETAVRDGQLSRERLEQAASQVRRAAIWAGQAR